MKLNDSNSIASGLDDQNRSPILQLIDLKTENDMEKVLAKIDAKFAQLDSKFAHIDSNFAQIDAKFTHVEDKIDTIKWVMIVAGGLLTLVVGFLALKIK